MKVNLCVFQKVDFSRSCLLLFTYFLDEEGVTISLDRLDPGREKPGSGGKEPSSFLPGDVVVPFVFEAQHVTSNVPAKYADDLSESFKVQCKL